MPWTSRYTLDVHSYQLDVYDHVNNAVYIQWLEHGRSRLLQDKDLSYTKIVEAWGVRFVTVRTEIDYRSPLHLGDTVEVSTRVEKIGNTSATFRQVVARSGGTRPAAEARVVIVFTDAQTGEPVPVPQPFVELFV